MEKYIFIAVAVLIVGTMVFKRVARKQQDNKSAGFAEERGWRHEKSDATILDSYPQLFPFYNQGRSISKPGLRRAGGRDDDAQGVLYFNVGDYPGHSFTYTYTVYDRDSDGDPSTKTEYWHVVGFELPIPLPQMTIRRRRKLDALENRLTKPVDLPHPGLSEAYTIHAEHPPAAFDLISPEMAQWLIAEQFKPEMVMQDSRIYVYAKGRQKIENVDPMIAQISGFLSRISAETWHKAQGEYPRPQRTQLVDGLNLNMMKDAYQQWRENK